MARPVECRIVDMPDGRFAVLAVLASGKVFRRDGLTTMAEAEESVEVLRAVMAACGAPLIRPGPDLPVLGNGDSLVSLPSRAARRQ